MIANIDSGVEHAHVREDALRGWVSVGRPAACVCCLCANMRVAEVRCGAVRCVAVQSTSASTLLCVCRGPALFFLCEADRLPVFVRLSVGAASSQTGARGMTAEVGQVYFQHKRHWRGKKKKSIQLCKE